MELHRQLKTLLRQIVGKIINPRHVATRTSEARNHAPSVD